VPGKTRIRRRLHDPGEHFLYFSSRRLRAHHDDSKHRLGGLPLFNGKLRAAAKTYPSSQLMFAGLGVVGLVFAWLLLSADRNNEGTLERAGD
jgi:hypothetical protein